MFPSLPGFTAPTNQQLADLAQTQRDPGLDSENNGSFPNETGSGFTYFGQFIDHDLTLDTSPQPSAPVDPSTLTNGRTFRFDLDSVYGGGPAASPQLYEADGVHFKLPAATSLPELTDSFQDLPRNPDGSAILIEGRNDENQIIGQIHAAFLRAHNRLIDEGHSFTEAQRILQWHYQWAVVHDFLPHIVGQNVVDSILSSNGTVRTRFYNPSSASDPMTPVEFSVAAYRFGHSQVRAAYFLNDFLGVKVPVFSLDPSVDQLSGGHPLGNHGIEWKYFFPELQDPADEEDVANANISRKIDTLISAPLFELPIPGAEASGSNVLAFRNLMRAKFYGLPSGQVVAARMGIRPIPAPSFNLGPGFQTGTPLWYYILAESQRVNGGRVLGPVGARIVAEVFLKLLALDPNSYLNRSFTPSESMAGDDGEMSLSDLLVFAGVTSRPEE